VVLRCAAGPEGRVDLRDLLAQLGLRGITSLLVEGGAAVHGSFLREGLWDELSLFLAPKLAGADGLSWAGFPGAAAMALALPLRVDEVCRVAGSADLLVRARPAL
jgi:diaminohydroxyphosphoribosylaminopyrimidine deaminase/5-amino-6-(5-phosphoribosylamino)uracil reductase